MEIVRHGQPQDQQAGNGQENQVAASESAPWPGIFQDRAGDSGDGGKLAAALALEPEDLGFHIHGSNFHYKAGYPQSAKQAADHKR
jgi:hypothetical protein